LIIEPVKPKVNDKAIYHIARAKACKSTKLRCAELIATGGPQLQAALAGLAGRLCLAVPAGFA
jgi:hypothetical protein